MMSKDQLILAAKEMRDKAYVPYSNFPVGAALLTKSGHVYTGCNIENAAYPVTCCAERVAIFKALSEGESEFSSMAVVADTKNPVSPCGSCRQVMSEFLKGTMKVYLANLEEAIETVTVAELLPFAFNSKDVLD